MADLRFKVEQAEAWLKELETLNNRLKSELVCLEKFHELKDTGDSIGHALSGLTDSLTQSHTKLITAADTTHHTLKEIKNSWKEALKDWIQQITHTEKNIKK